MAALLVNDPYFSVKAATTCTLDALEKLRLDVVIPLVQTMMLRQQQHMMRSLSSIEVPSHGATDIGLTDLENHTLRFEADLSKVGEALSFLDRMLSAIRGGGRFPPEEVLARQRFFERVSTDSTNLMTFTSALKAVVSNLREGKLLIHSQVNAALASEVNRSGIIGRGETRLPPPHLNSSIVAIDTTRAQNAKRMNDAAKERSRLMAEEAHINDNEHFMQVQREVQREEMRIQEEALGRIQGHLGSMKDSVVNIRDELHTQDLILEEQMGLSEKVKANLQATNAKVNHLLENMSDRGKYLLIFFLSIILIALIIIVM